MGGSIASSLKLSVFSKSSVKLNSISHPAIQVIVTGLVDTHGNHQLGDLTVETLPKLHDS